MKKITLLSEDHAKCLGYKSNYIFARDIRSPDITHVSSFDWREKARQFIKVDRVKHFENQPTEMCVYNKDGTAILYLGTSKEINSLRKTL